MSMWCSVSDVRRVTGVSETDFSDSEINEFIINAQKEINSKIITKVYREPVYFLDQYRSNKIDGSNRTFFMKNWRLPSEVNYGGSTYAVPINSNPYYSYGRIAISNPNAMTTKINYLGDFNYDAQVDVNDIVVVKYDPNTGTESTLSVESIDTTNCSFTLTTAPSNVQLYVTYAFSPLDPVNPDPFIALAVAYLAGSYLFVGTDGFEIKFGNVTLKPGSAGGKGKQFYDKYNELLSQVITNSNGSSLYSDMQYII